MGVRIPMISRANQRISAFSYTVGKILPNIANKNDTALQYPSCFDSGCWRTVSQERTAQATWKSPALFEL